MPDSLRARARGAGGNAGQRRAVPVMARRPTFYASRRLLAGPGLAILGQILKGARHYLPTRGKFPSSLRPLRSIQFVDPRCVRHRHSREEVGAQCAPMAVRRARLLALATAVLCAWRQPGTHAYDPFQTDTSAPWNKNASKRFHPVCVCARGARRAARPARARAAYVRA